MMKNILLILLIFLLAGQVYGQRFLASMESNEDTLIFKISPTGGSITTNWSDIEFFLRWPDSSPAFTFGDILVNTTDFPGVSIPNNGTDVQGSETGFTNNWFGTSFSATASQTYNFGSDYWVFKVVVNGPAQATDIAFELCHNNNFAPFYLALTDGAGSDLTANDDNLKFYGNDAQICGPVNCPASTPGTNHIVSLPIPLPVDLVSFESYKLNETDALLKWATASEINSSHFEIERSTDAVDWRLIATEQARGYTNANQNYDFIDKDVFNTLGIHDLFYYRLKIIDLDGTFEYADIRSVQFDRPQATWNIFPNPVTTDVYLNVENGSRMNETKLYLYNITGQLILQKQVAKGEFEMPYHLDLTQENISPGTYLLLLFEEERQILSERLIVQDL